MMQQSIISLLIFTYFVLAVIATYFLAGYLAYERGADIPVNGDQVILKYRQADMSIKAILKRVVLLAATATAILFLLTQPLKWGIPVLPILMLYNSLIILSLLAKFILESFKINSLPPRFKYEVGILITCLWYFLPNYLTLNAACFLIVLWFLIEFRKMSLKEVVALSGGIMIYDLIAVFQTQTMQVLAKAALKQELPMLFIIPSSFSLSSERLFALGLGDVIFPGLIIMVGIQNAKYHKIKKMAWLPIAGYVIGLIITLTVLAITKFPQPATIYLMPATLSGLLLAAWINKIKIWN